MPSKLELMKNERGEVRNILQRQVVVGLGTAKNRGRLDVVADVLGTCSRGANKSRIMLTANINSVTATECLSRLIDSDLLTVGNEDGITVLYYQTQQGFQFVRKYSELKSMLSPGMVPQARMNHQGSVAEAWI